MLRNRAEAVAASRRFPLSHGSPPRSSRRERRACAFRTPLRTHDGASTPVALDTHSGYDGEVRHLLSALASGSRELDATLEDALVHTRVIEAERKSLGVRQPVMVRR